MTATTTLPAGHLKSYLADHGYPPRVPQYMDPCWCSLDKKRVRFVRFVDSTSVEVADNDGNVLPDYRHPSQLRVMH